MITVKPYVGDSETKSTPKCTFSSSDCVFDNNNAIRKSQLKNGEKVGNLLDKVCVDSVIKANVNYMDKREKATEVLVCQHLMMIITEKET